MLFQFPFIRSANLLNCSTSIIVAHAIFPLFRGILLSRVTFRCCLIQQWRQPFHVSSSSPLGQREREYYHLRSASIVPLSRGFKRISVPRSRRPGFVSTFHTRFRCTLNQPERELPKVTAGKYPYKNSVRKVSVSTCAYAIHVSSRFF